jgi:hypothetical protein
MVRVVKVYPISGGWEVKGDTAGKGKSNAQTVKVFSNQKEAIQNGRAMVREAAPSQLVIFGKDGRVRDHITYGIPKIQEPPVRAKGSLKIERAVGRVALSRHSAEPTSTRG